MKTLRALSLTLAIATFPTLSQAPRPQSPANHKPSFEVASVRLEDPSTPFGAYNGPGPNTPQQFPSNHITLRHIMLRSLICENYAVQCSYILGGPDWIDHQHYDLTAKVEGDALLTEEQMQPLMQTLLEERFHLVTHREQKGRPRLCPGHRKGRP